jgi:hypothetical protein
MQKRHHQTPIGDNIYAIVIHGQSELVLQTSIMKGDHGSTTPSSYCILLIILQWITVANGRRRLQFSRSITLALSASSLHVGCPSNGSQAQKCQTMALLRTRCTRVSPVILHYLASTLLKFTRIIVLKMSSELIQPKKATDSESAESITTAPGHIDSYGRRHITVR